MAFLEDVSREDLEDGVAVSVEIEGEARKVALYLVDGEPRGFDDVCPHAGVSLSEGGVRDGALRCPRHGAAFDVDTGEPVDLSANPASEALEMYDVEFIDGGIEVSRRSSGT